MAKEGYKPTAGMQSAARRAIKLKEQGKAKGAGTAVGWTRAGQLARGESLSLDTVKRMYSFFSRHEVDKKGKDWGNAENPSNGKIMWLAWGGDAGFSWSRAIVNREKNKVNKAYGNEIVEEIKSMFDDVIDPITEEIQIDDTEDIQKALRAEVSREQLYELVQHLHEAIEALVETPDTIEEDDMAEESDITIEDANPGNPSPVGDPDKNPINWPIAKSEEIEDLNKAKDKYDNIIKPRKGEPADKELYARIIAEAKRKFDVYPSAYANGWVVQEYKKRGGTYKVSKSIFEGSFDPYDLVKRKFSPESRRRMADSGNAMPDGSYPIGNKQDLMNAIRSWGRGGSDPKVKAHIKRRAKELGAEDMIPENWK
jgi:hypothetical protein